MLLFSLLVLLSVMLYFLDVRLSRPRVIQEFALSRESWDEIRRFWESVGRLS
jgi:hypothetical protein